MNMLFSEFDPSDKDAWFQLASKEIKNRDYAETLGWKADSNLILDPLYTLEEFNNISGYLSLSRNMTPGWTTSIPLDLSKNSVHEIIKKIEFLQSWDVQAIVIDARTKNISKTEMLEILGCCQLKTAVYIKDETERLLIWYYQWIQDCELNGTDPKHLKGGLLSTSITEEDSSDWQLLMDLFKATELSPLLRLVAIEISSADSLSKEISEAISSAHDCFCTLAEKGSDSYRIDTNRILSAFLFDVSINQMYIEQAAKLRTIRTLWGNICSEYGFHQDQTLIMTKSSSFPADKVHDDNLIRETLVAMSSVMGGANIVNMTPVKNDKDALRWAVNIHHLLKHEARLDLVADMAGGSYAIEKLTSELSKSAWEKFLKKEEQGGRLNG